MGCVVSAVRGWQRLLHWPQAVHILYVAVVDVSMMFLMWKGACPLSIEAW